MLALLLGVWHAYIRRQQHVKFRWTAGHLFHIAGIFIDPVPSDTGIFSPRTLIKTTLARSPRRTMKSNIMAYRGSFTPNNVYNCNPESLQYLVCFQMILTFLQDMMNWNESSQSFVETFIVDSCPQANLNPQWRVLRHHVWLVWMRWWDVLGCYCTWCKGRSKKLKENKKR